MYVVVFGLVFGVWFIFKPQGKKHLEQKQQGNLLLFHSHIPLLQYPSPDQAFYFQCVLLGFSLSSLLTQDGFRMMSTDPTWVLPIPEAAEEGEIWFLHLVDSAVNSHCSLTSLLPGRLLSPAHRCDSTAAAQGSRLGLVQGPCSGLNISRGLPLQTIQHQVMLHQGFPVLLLLPSVPSFLALLYGILWFCSLCCLRLGLDLLYPLSLTIFFASQSREVLPAQAYYFLQTNGLSITYLQRDGKILAIFSSGGKIGQDKYSVKEFKFLNGRLVF